MKDLRTIPVFSVVAALCALAAALCAMAAAAPASQAQTNGSARSALCAVRTLPATFMDQGEQSHAGSVADIVEVQCNPEVYGAGQTLRLSSQQLYSRCGGHLTWSAPYPLSFASGPTFRVTLDGDGNATAVLWAGPNCQAGESLVSAHQDEAPYETYTTAFRVLPPADTPPGLTALPSSKVEDSVHSSVATIVQVEFPSVYAEKYVHISAEELFSRCQVRPHLLWVGSGPTVLSSAPPPEGEPEPALAPSPLTGAESVSKVQLDNNGNAFVVLLGGGSCASGTSLIEADLESPPFTTYTTTFTVLPPQPSSEESAFTIEKLQQLPGTTFTGAPLSGSIGQTVQYEIVVKNTGPSAETFSGFTDARCDPGTIAGGPGGSPVAAGASTVYTCSHLLSAVGVYTNEATVTGTAANVPPTTHTSNQVVVSVAPEPSFTIEKMQQIAGTPSGFTTAQLTGLVGQTVQYEIVVTNTGNEALSFTSFSDPRCDAGTIAGGPGEASLAPGASTTYTCSHVLTSTGTYVNQATVTGTPPGGAPITHPSPTVEVLVRPGQAYFTLEKLQQLAGGSGGFTTSPITATIGQTVLYEIIVRNTGAAPLKISGFSDPRCDAGTIGGGPGEEALAPGSSTTFTCSHVLTAAGSFVNEASATGTPEGESPFTQTSNHVEANVPAALEQLHAAGPGPASGPHAATAPATGGVLARCESHTQPLLRGVGGPKRRVFTLRISSLGIKQVTFYLDGHRLRTLGSAQARGGSFTIRIDARKLSFGAHRVMIKALMTDVNCASLARSGVFVHPRTQSVPVKFTG